MFDLSNLSKFQKEKLDNFRKETKKEYVGCSGGQYTYCFTPTTLGLVISVIDNVSKKEVNLTEYENW